MYIHHITVEYGTKLNAVDVITVDVMLCACASALSFLLLVFGSGTPSALCKFGQCISS